MNTHLKQVKDLLELAKQSNWSVTELARQCNVSIRTLQRYFTNNMCATPKTWLAKQRNQQAICLLRNGYSVKETATRLGYAHSTHFSRQFKKSMGAPPTVVATRRSVFSDNCRI
jgi:transcriptional regulator GlxA family with amidase domain